MLAEGGSALRVVAAGRIRPDLGPGGPRRCRSLPRDRSGRPRLLRGGDPPGLRRHAPGDDARWRAGVLERTEGWPAGVLSGRPRRPAPPARRPPAVRPEVISGDDVYIADYFRDEVLAAEPSDDVTVPAAHRRPRSDVRTPVRRRPRDDRIRRRLREAARRNLFVVPVTRRGGPVVSLPPAVQGDAAAPSCGCANPARSCGCTAGPRPGSRTRGCRTRRSPMPSRAGTCCEPRGSSTCGRGRPSPPGAAARCSAGWASWTMPRSPRIRRSP